MTVQNFLLQRFSLEIKVLVWVWFVPSKVSMLGSQGDGVEEVEHLRGRT
jgi:hypothetical protein